MSIFRNNDLTDIELSLVIDGEATPAQEQRIKEKIDRDPEYTASYKRLSGISDLLSKDLSPKSVTVSQDRVRDRLVASVGATFPSATLDRGSWWQRSVSLPLPVIAAATVLFLVMAVGLMMNPGVLSNQEYTAGHLASERSVNVQVQVNGEESDLLLRWLEEQNQVGNVTIQLPEHAEFQLRGEPVLMKPGDTSASNDESEFEIVPLEAPAE